MTKPKVQMTQHASMRLSERSRLSLEMLEVIFNRNFPIRIGACRQPGKYNLAHRVFFSPVDRAFLVAIQNIMDGAVLTLLTFEQYRNHYSDASISSRVLREVNRMVVEGLAPATCWQQLTTGERVLVYADFGIDIRQASLGQFQTVIAGPSLDGLGGLPKFWGWIANRCETLRLPIDQIHTVTARLPYGDAQEVHFLCA